MASRRQRRVSELIHRKISSLLQSKMRDPRLSLVTVTAVETSPDLRHAHVYISAMGTEAERREALKGLVHAAGFLRHELGAHLPLRYVPELTFHLDESLERGARVIQLLQEIREEKGGDEGGHGQQGAS